MRSGNDHWYRLCCFFEKLLIINFAGGVATGITMEMAFGILYGPFSQAVGPFFGQVLGYETITAFMYEAGFIGLMIFGWGKISKRMHLFATFNVALSAAFSAMWILVAVRGRCRTGPRSTRLAGFLRGDARRCLIAALQAGFPYSTAPHHDPESGDRNSDPDPDYFVGDVLRARCNRVAAVHRLRAGIFIYKMKMENQVLDDAVISVEPSRAYKDTSKDHLRAQWMICSAIMPHAGSTPEQH